ncbi:unnamed protein product [Meganyctiphanes norvegica]|uniref:Sodium-coupled monocarboxylate transporter 1 n=1 Tax=Meganyctiphanes norvegica TaxID=48144 RepID=A0AAV2RJ72_MEGNR
MNGFSGWDWAIFSIFLCGSLGTGVVAGWIGRRKVKKKQKEGSEEGGGAAEEFLSGGRKMNPVMIAMSTMIGAISSISVVGNPAEMYAYGTQLWSNLFGMCLGFIYVHLVILTVLYPLKITSVYTYIEKRFKSPALRTFTVCTTFIGTFFYMGLCSYAPSLAMETITNFPAWASVIILGVICTVYTAWGGVRAVVWTDMLQSIVLFIGVIFIIIKATTDVGSISEVWTIADNYNRVEFFNFDPSPLQRHSFWLVSVQGYFYSLLVMGMGQPQVQRICSVETWNKAIGAHYLNMVLNVALYSLLNYMGLAVYALYAGCDPMGTGEIKKPDQIVPFYVDQELGYLHGIAGLFMAALYAGALSSYSSQINAVAAVLWEDFFKNSKMVAKMEPERRPIVIVIIGVITGCAGIVSGIIAGFAGGIFQFGQIILGCIHAPLLGLFILGMCNPMANKVGSTIGFSTSLLFNIWITLGSVFYGEPDPTLPWYEDECPILNVTSTMSYSTTIDAFTTMSSTSDPNDHEPFALYMVSYTLYSLFGVSITFFVGSIASLATGPWSTDESGEKYLHPTFYKLMRKWEKKHQPNSLDITAAKSTNDLIELEKH